MNPAEAEVRTQVAQWRTELTALIDQRSKLEDWSEAWRVNLERQKVLKKNIEAAFRQHFGGLKPSERARTVFHKLRSSEGGYAFDHCSYYRRATDRALVLVSQPYGYNRAELLARAQAAGAQYLDTEEWGWYYPGHANSFMLVLPPTATKPRKSPSRRTE